MKTLESKSFYEHLQIDLDNMTYDEVLNKYEVSKQQLNKWIQEKDLKVKYKRRTRYTNTLVPVDSEWDKFVGKKLEDYNKFHAKANPKSYYDRQIESYTTSKEKREAELGMNVVRIQQLESQNKYIMQAIDSDEHIINLLNKCKKNKDYAGFLEEVELSTPPSENKQVKEYLSDAMVLGYLTEKYGLEVGLKVKNILNIS